MVFPDNIGLPCQSVVDLHDFFSELLSIPNPHFLESETVIGIQTSVHGLGDPQKFYNGLHIYQSFFPFFIPFFLAQPVLPLSLSSYLFHSPNHILILFSRLHFLCIQYIYGVKNMLVFVCVSV